MVDLNQIALELESLIESWRVRLLALDGAVVHERPNADRWSISEVIGHLVDSACNNHQRFVRAQFCSDLVFPGYEQREWVLAGNYHKSQWESLVELWYLYNRQIATVIRNIRQPSLSTPCTITPNEPRTLGFLVSDYVDHMKHHFRHLDLRLVD